MNCRRKGFEKDNKERGMREKGREKERYRERARERGRYCR